MTEVIEVLRQARYLVSQGWTQHAASHEHQGGGISYCAWGAIRHVLWEKGTWEYGQVGRSQPAIVALGYTIWGHPVNWNDCPGRTKRQVLDAFDVTIARLEKAHAKIKAD